MSPHALLQSKIPAWLTASDASTRAAFRRKLGQPLPWFQLARDEKAAQVASLLGEHAVHRFDQQQVNQVLDQLPSAEAFAEPLLKAALKQRFALDIDVRACYLFHAAQVRLDVSFEAQDPLVMLQTALKAATMSLLKAALQNFEASQAEPGGMDHETGSKAAIYAAYPLEGVFIAGPTLDLAPEAFAALCRELDLGGQYKQLIERTFNPPSAPGDASDAAAVNRATTFKLFEQSAFRLQVHLAYLQNAIDPGAYAALLALPTGARLPDKALTCSTLRLWGVELTGIVVISPDRDASAKVERITVYIPDDPINPLREYASSSAFAKALRSALQTPGYLRFFERFVPARHRDELFRRIHAAFYPKVWVADPGWYEHKLDRNARLQLDAQRFTEPLLTQLYRQKVAVLKDDGLFHAVPTAVEDHKSREQKWLYFAGKLFDAANVAAFVVPGLGEVMLAVTAVQLGYEAYEGLESLIEGDRDAAFGYLMDVVDNLALMAALAAAGAAADGPPAAVEVPEVVGQMRAVQRPDGSTALWRPELAPFAHDIVLPRGLKPNASGLYEYQGKQWLALDGQVYALKPSANGAAYRLQHPRRAGAYEPVVRHNGAGAWVSEAEQPLAWEGLKLLRRLQPGSAVLSDEVASQVLRVSDTHEAVMRRALAEGERSPALLEDTLQRFELDQAIKDGDSQLSVQQRRELFATRYAMWDSTGRADVGLVRKAFPGLPVKVAEELLSHASSAELQQLSSTQRLPERIAEEARAYLQQVRLARACEGLYLEAVPNVDSDRLVLHALERLPGWASTLRIELRELSFEGRLIDSIGAIDAPERKVLIKEGDSYLARDARDQHLHGRDDIYGALLHALPDAQRAALGVPHVGQTAEFKRVIRALPVPSRQVLRQQLQLQPLKPASRSPMRLANGRLGYPLSGRGALAAYFTEDTLLDKIRLLEFEDAYADAILQDFYAAGLTRSEINTHLDRLLDEQVALRASLDAWALESAAIIDLTPARSAGRQRIGQALWAHWRANGLLGIRGAATALRLDSTMLSDFPESLPGFMYARTQALVLSDVTVDAPLDTFLSRFSELTDLEVSRSGTSSAYLPVNVLGIIVARCPRLTALSVNRLILPVEQPAIDMLRGLVDLRRLDLSGNWLEGELDFSGFELDYLGLERLDWIGNTRWPSWLNSAMLDTVAEVSLAHNRITELPDFVVHNPMAARHTRIGLQGNVLPRATIIDLRLNEGAGRRFSFDLDVPDILQADLGVMVQEHATLARSIEDWVQSSGSSAALSEERLAARRRLGDGILNYWALRTRQGGAAVLHLEDIALAEFPRSLPPFFYERVVRLHLTRPRATAGELDHFLGSFAHTYDLAIAGHLTPMTELPAALLRMRALESLSLTDQGLLVDQAAMNFFAQIPALDMLELDGNRLGVITDVTGLGRGRLHLLSLNEVGLHSWPDWLSRMLPHAVEVLALEGNQLTELPASILRNARDDRFRCEINLRGNPLDYETMRQAHVSESYYRPFAFSMDLPDDILALSQSEPHSSDTPGSDATTQHTHSPGMTPEAPTASVEPWVEAALDQEASRRQAWQQIEDSDDAQDLLRLIARLQHTADYRTPRTRPDLVSRVWQVLQAAAQDTELRLTLNGMAQEPLEQIVQHATCPDGIRLEFNQMEVLVYTRRALQDVPELQRGSTLYRLMRRLYRLHQLDSIAVEQAGVRDQAEVRLAYRLRWAQVLDLPLAPGSMLYEASANLQPGELDRALTRVQQGEHGQPLLAYAAQRDFWVEYLRETFAERFRALKQAYEARVLEVTDLYPDDTPDQTSARISALERTFRNDERNLIDELTNRAGVDYA